MKKFITVVLFVFIGTFVIAQNKSVVPVINQTADYINLIEQKYEQQIVHLEYDVIKSNKEVYRELFAGVQYGIMIFGDDDIKDVNLKISRVIDDAWTVVTEDKETEGIVMLFFTPQESDLYKFDLSAVLKNKDAFGFYSFIIFR